MSTLHRAVGSPGVWGLGFGVWGLGFGVGSGRERGCQLAGPEMLPGGVEIIYLSIYLSIRGWGEDLTCIYLPGRAWDARRGKGPGNSRRGAWDDTSWEGPTI